MTYRTLVLEKKGHLAYVSLCRPAEGNSLNQQALGELASAAAALNDDPDCYVMILTGRDDVFCSGWDVSQIAAETPLEWARRERIFGDPFSFLSNLSRPVIAAVNGDAVSAGLELALACDVRICSEEARFGLPETAFGLLPMGGGTQRLPRVVGRAKALEMVLTGEIIEAAEALRIGMVSKVVPRARLMAEAEALAAEIAGRGPIAIRYAKEAVLRGVEMPLEQALRFETDLTIILQTTEDRAEGVSAFLEKRNPRFKGR
jgi:enoyl-CoA hydratase/carnithine racemase